MARRPTDQELFAALDSERWRAAIAHWIAEARSERLDDPGLTRLQRGWLKAAIEAQGTPPIQPLVRRTEPAHDVGLVEIDPALAMINPWSRDRLSAIARSGQAVTNHPKVFSMGGILGFSDGNHRLAYSLITGRSLLAHLTIYSSPEPQNVTFLVSDEGGVWWRLACEDDSHAVQVSGWSSREMVAPRGDYNATLNLYEAAGANIIRLPPVKRRPAEMIRRRTFLDRVLRR